MHSIRSLFALCLFLVAILPIAAARPATALSDIERMPYRAVIESGPASDGAPAVIELPPEVLDRARADLADLRIASIMSGTLLPFRLYDRSASPPRVTLYSSAAKKIGEDWTSNELTTFVYDFGEPLRRNRLRITCPNEQFVARVRIDGSDDRSTWTVLRERAPLFRFDNVSDGGGITEKDTVIVPENAYRYVRIKIVEDRESWEPVEIRRVRSAYVPAPGPPSPDGVDVPIASADRSRDDKQGVTSIVLDLGFRHLRVAGLRFAAETPEFVRFVDVTGRNDRGADPSDSADWHPDANDLVYRQSAPGGAGESLTLPVTSGRYRYLRVRVYDLDDPPVPLDVTAVSRRPVRLSFRPDGPGPFALYFGNPGILVPGAERTGGNPPAANATLAPVEASPEFVALRTRGSASPRMRDRLLAAALVAAVVALGLAIVRLRKRAGSRG